MTREAFEMVARMEYPELSFARTADGEYLTAQTQGWWMGWKLAMGEMVQPVVPDGMNYSDIVRWTPKTVVGGGRA